METISARISKLALKFVNDNDAKAAYGWLTPSMREIHFGEIRDVNPAQYNKRILTLKILGSPDWACHRTGRDWALLSEVGQKNLAQAHSALSCCALECTAVHSR